MHAEQQESPRATLCRCGASKVKPYCDGSHEEVGFSDKGEVTAFNPDDKQESGIVEIKALKNGPLYLLGPHCICDAAGSIARVCYKITLCRCGVSKVKPYCDGSHAGIDFKAD